MTPTVSEKNIHQSGEREREILFNFNQNQCHFNCNDLRAPPSYSEEINFAVLSLILICINSVFCNCVKVRTVT